MPRFHFPIVDGTTLNDPVGIELPTAERAKQHAENIARHLLDLGKDRNVLAIGEDGDEIHRVAVNKIETT